MSSLELTPLVRGLKELEIRSCLIVQQGNIMLEYYREPQFANELYKINSCTKSVIAALVSIAMDQQIVPQPDTPILNFFPQIAEDSDTRKRDITIEHLLTMSAGFNWTEFGGQNSFPTMSRTSDWVQFVLSQPLADVPGTRMEYNSGCSQLLATILRHASGQAVAEFAEQQLFQPLGIENYHWETDPQGTHTGGFGLRLKPVDMLQFGLLYLTKEAVKAISSYKLRPSGTPPVRSFPRPSHKKPFTAGTGGLLPFQTQRRKALKRTIITRSALAVNILLSSRLMTWWWSLLLTSSKRNGLLWIYSGSTLFRCFSSKDNRQFQSKKKACPLNQASLFLQYNRYTKKIANFICKRECT